MGFKEELRIPLSTVSADVLASDMSHAEWNLRTPVVPPNANYKIKYQVSTAAFPNTYAKISKKQGNNSLIIAYGDSPTFDVRDAVDVGEYVKIELGQPLTSIDWGGLQNVINARIRAVMSDPAEPIHVYKYKPQFFYDDNNFRTFSLRVTDWSLPDTAVVSNEATPPAMQQEPVGGWIEDALYFKLVTQADAVERSDEDLRLANVMGFPRSESVPVVSRDTPLDEYDLGVSGGVVRAPRVPDLLGTRFVTLRTNLKTSAIDPVTLSETNVMCVVPVTVGDQESTSLYFVGNIQQPQFVTLAAPSIDRIKIELTDDHNKPLAIEADWYVELSVLFEEAEKTDVYRGTNDFTVPALMRNVFDARGYKTLQQELAEIREMIEEDEYQQRSTRPLKRVR